MSDPLRRAAGIRAGWPALAVVAVALAVGAAPLLFGPPGGDDAYYHAMRAQQQARCWLGGVLLPRWYPDLNGGLGGPEPRAYPLLPLSLQAALALASGDGVVATSLATLLIAVSAGVVTFGVGRRRGVPAPWATVVAATWSASPYLVIALHERVSLAEGWGLAVLPWVLDASLPPRPGSRRESAEAALAWAVLLATQLPLSLMTCLVAGALQIAAPRRERVGRLVGAGVLGAAVAAISWLPNVAALGRTASGLLTAGEFAFGGQFLPGGLANDPALARQLLLALAGVGGAAAVLAVRERAATRREAVAALAAALMAMPLAAPLYRFVPGLAMLQFPWRWAGVAGCLVTLAALHAQRRVARVVAVGLLLAPLAAVSWTRWRLAPGEPLRPSDSGRVAARAATRYGVPPILPSLPAYLPRDVDLLRALTAAAHARTQVTRLGPWSPDRFAFSSDAAAGGSVRLPLLAADGWEVTVDGRPAGWRSDHGLVTVAAGPGRHVIVARQGWLPEDVAGATLSLVGVAGLFLLASGGRRRPITG